MRRSRPSIATPGRRSHPPGGPRRRHRRQPRQPRQVLLRQPHDGRAAHRGGAAGGPEEARGARHRSAPTPSSRPVPFNEDDLWNGYPEETNAPYGLAKKMLLVQSAGVPRSSTASTPRPVPGQPLRPARQLRPPHLARDPGAHPQVRRGARARRTARSSCGGRARPRASSSTCEDAAEGIVAAAERYDRSEPVNLGCGLRDQDQDLVPMIARLSGSTGDDSSGTPQAQRAAARQLDISRAEGAFGWTRAQTRSRTGCGRPIAWFEENRGNGS